MLTTARPGLQKLTFWHEVKQYVLRDRRPDDANAYVTCPICKKEISVLGIEPRTLTKHHDDRTRGLCVLPCGHFVCSPCGFRAYLDSVDENIPFVSYSEKGHEATDKYVLLRRIHHSNQRDSQSCYTNSSTSLSCLVCHQHLRFTSCGHNIGTASYPGGCYCGRKFRKLSDKPDPQMICVMRVEKCSERYAATVPPTIPEGGNIPALCYRCLETEFITTWPEGDFWSLTRSDRVCKTNPYTSSLTMTVNAKYRAQDEFVREWREKEVIGKDPCWELNLNDITFFEESDSDDSYSDRSDQTCDPAAIDEREDENEEGEDEQYEYQEDEDDIMEDLDQLSGSDDGENNEPSGTYYDEGNERDLRTRLQELNIRAQEATTEAAPSQNVPFNSSMEWEGIEVDEYIPPWAGHL